MVDTFTRRQRSEIMSKVKGRKNLATEMRLVGILRKHKISGWRRKSRVFGNPDFVFPKSRVAVFVDGCFWHCCPIHGTLPASNRTFWKRKLAKNKRRDSLVRRNLQSLGWKVVRIWQHDLQKPQKVIRRLTLALT